MLALVAVAATGDRAGTSKDPLAAEIERWSNYLQTHQGAGDPDWPQVKQATLPLIDTAKQALRDGRRMWALQRLTAAEGYLAASQYVGNHSEGELKSAAALETEWHRVGGVLGADLGKPSPAALQGVQPAAVRAIGEAALPQVKIYYDASLDFARNTMAESGYFYLGSALGQRDVVELCRKISEPSPGAPPPLRSLAPDLDRFEAEILAAYRPPAAIEKHDQFIVASGALKEARELDAAGLRYGALLRYLQAAVRFAPLRPAGKPLDPAALEKQLQDFHGRLSRRRDDSIGRLFLEIAEADSQSAAPGKAAETAVAIVQDVLPRYFTALEPARPEAPKPLSEVTVTLVRWPYT
jgi:hypothetical protein